MRLDRMPRWLRRKVIGWSNSTVYADAQRYAEGLRQETFRLHDLLAGQADELKRANALLAQTQRSLVEAENALSQANTRWRNDRQRYQKLRDVDRELAAGRIAELDQIKKEYEQLLRQRDSLAHRLSNLDHENITRVTRGQASEIRQLREQLAKVTAERDRARMVQMAGYDLDNVADEKRYADVAGD